MARMALIGLMSGLYLLSGLGCNQGENDDEHSPSDTRFSQGEALAQDWCTTAQMHLAALEGTSLDKTKIEQFVPASTSELTLAKAGIDETKDSPIKIVSFAPQMSNTTNDGAPETLSTHIICKMKSQEGIEAGLGIEIPGEEGTCREVNQLALDWADSQLTPAEKSKYQNEGKTLALADDLMGISGSTWYGTQSKFSEEGDAYYLASSALIVPYDIAPGFPEELRGVHYCKLLSPAQVLYWMLQRAFWDDPVGAGPNDDEGAALVVEGGCEPTEAPSTGSCIFLFEVSEQHYCEEYTGTKWTEASVKERCAGRTEGVFLSESCSARKSETHSLDGDGVYKGVCLINCGTEEEYRWHVYSEPAGDTPIEQYCQDWFPVS